MTPADFEAILETLRLVSEYMDDRADADGDSECFHPNQEMRLGQEVDQAIARMESYK